MNQLKRLSSGVNNLVNLKRYYNKYKATNHNYDDTTFAKYNKQYQTTS